MQEYYYLLSIWGDVEPELLGPYETPEERDEAAREIRRGEDGGLYPITLVAGDHDLMVETYSHGFFEGED